jgi:hypothetical protein
MRNSADLLLNLSLHARASKSRRFGSWLRCAAAPLATPLWEKIETGEYFAMKIIYAARCQDSQSSRDARRVEITRHPLIVFAFSFQTDLEVFLCLERVAGGGFCRNLQQMPPIRLGDVSAYIFDRSLAIAILHVHWAICCFRFVDTRSHSQWRISTLDVLTSEHLYKICGSNARVRVHPDAAGAIPATRGFGDCSFHLNHAAGTHFSASRFRKRHCPVGPAIGCDRGLGSPYQDCWDGIHGGGRD